MRLIIDKQRINYFVSAEAKICFDKLIGQSGKLRNINFVDSIYFIGLQFQNLIKLNI